jgi:hypothetical protein
LFLNSAFLILEVCSCIYNRRMLLKYLKTQYKSFYSVTGHTASSSSPLYVKSMCGRWCHQKITYDQLFGQLKRFTILITLLKVKDCTGSANQKVGWWTFPCSVMDAVGPLGRSKQVLSCQYQLWDQ